MIKGREARKIVMPVAWFAWILSITTDKVGIY
uniref:Uncharacterized protein n=1 Tax=Arundo donax TaxID=35708 RepID=A0A0A9C022_ARUDO